MTKRMTCEEIVKKYPHQNVGLVGCQPDSMNIESAIIKYTEKETSYDDLCLMAFRGEIALRYTTPEDIDIATPFLPSDFID